MRSRTILTAILSLGFAAAVLAQASGPPKPGPEVKKLDAFAGKWEGESEMKPSAFGPGGKMKSEDDCTWFEGGFQLVCLGSGEGAMGKFKSEGVLAWSGEEKVYKYAGFDSMGMMTTATGAVSGDTWTWHGQDKMGGKTIHSRYAITLTSPTTQSFKWETSEDGKTWTTVAEGKSKKK